MNKWPNGPRTMTEVNGDMFTLQWQDELKSEIEFDRERGIVVTIYAHIWVHDEKEGKKIVKKGGDRIVPILRLGTDTSWPGATGLDFLNQFADELQKIKQSFELFNQEKYRSTFEHMIGKDGLNAATGGLLGQIEQAHKEQEDWS